MELPWFYHPHLYHISTRAERGYRRRAAKAKARLHAYAGSRDISRKHVPVSGTGEEEAHVDEEEAILS
jgi:hypothetical protein